MKKTLFLATAFVIFLIAFAAGQNGNPIHGRLNGRGNPNGNNSGGGSPNSTGQSGTGSNIDVIYHKIYWRINPDSATKYIKGYVQTNFKTITSNVTAISLDMNAVLSVDSVRFRGAKLAAGNISHVGNIVTITLGATLANNFIDSFTVYYGGTPPAIDNPPGAVGYQKSSASGEGNYIYTLSESYEDRDWWPCKADMKDKIDSMDITVSVPWGTPTTADTFWVACNGRMVDSTISGTSRYFTFKSRYPMASYLVSVGVAKFNKYYRSVNINGTTVPVVYNIFRGKASYTTILSKMDSMNLTLSEFSNKLGDYPFKNEKHGFYEFGFGGGMEHQTFSGIGSGSLTSATILAHELMHQWFGDNVTFGTWNDLWLAEGFAAYGELQLYYELVAKHPLTAFSLMTNKKSTALGETVSTWMPDATAGSSSMWNSAYGSSVYDRGCMVVSMLRAIAGDTKFFQALTNYQTTLHGSAASADTLRNYFNAVLGMDIDPFFRDYVGGSGPGASAIGGIGNPINPVNWNCTSNRLVIQMGTQTKSATNNVTYFRGPVVMRFSNGVKDTTITIFDWGGGKLSYAGNGMSDSIPGNILNFDLSFTPTSAFYDDSARTMSTGSMPNVPALRGYSWTGATNSNWNTTTNWANGVVPPSGAQVTIATTGSAPVLPSAISVGGLFMNSGTTLNIGSNTLTIDGPVSASGATITGSATSNIIINGIAGSHLIANRNVGTLNFNQSSAATRSINNITLNAGSSATLGTALDVYGVVSLNSATLDLAGKNLTLKSTAAATALIDDLTGSTLNNATNVTVERYISDVGHRAWRLLSVPVTGSQTIKQAWQENGVLSANLGTNITSNLYNGLNGFDMASGSASILTHNQGGVSGPSWNFTLANTSSTLLTAYPGYMLFVRGDRNATPGNSLHAATVLRATGTIRQGTQGAITISSTGTGYTLVGNPYPSPVDFEVIAGTANLAQSYYLWDPTLAGNNGVGGYRLVQRTAPNTYQQTPVVLGGPVADPTIRYIHSGQAFFLKATGANANVVFTESSKASTVSIVNPIVQGGANDPQLIANLMVIDPTTNTASLADGLRISFNENNQANTSDDILKIGNFGENLSSLREEKSLIVENRPAINKNDTIFLKMTNVKIKKYRFQIGTIDFTQNNLYAELQDNYLDVNTPLNLAVINNINFSVTADPSSSLFNRFKIVFWSTAPKPMIFTSIKAYKVNAAIAVEWKVSNQVNLKNYEIERSTNGTTFSTIATQAVLGANGSDATYNWMDNDPAKGDNFYRIRSVDNNGDFKYSSIVNVMMEKERSGINVYPNPVTSKMLNLQFTNMQKGIYGLRLINTMGQVVFTQQLTHRGGSAIQNIGLGNNIQKGIYRLEVIHPDNTKTNVMVNVME